MHYARVLSIAGSDSGGGAGIQADLKTFAALGCYGMTAITAVTAQNTTGVSAIHAVPVDVLQAQLDMVISDIGVDAVKIGMLHSPEVVEVVAATIRKYGLQNIVLDPVMVSANGDPLIAPETVSVLVQKLFPLVSVITPNLDEAALLLGRPLNTQSDLKQAAVDLQRLGAPAVLLKGAHLDGTEILDTFLPAEGEALALRHPRIATRNIHGSGCTLSSAIAAQLALGDVLPQAIIHAHTYTRAAIAAGADVHTGQGKGPLNHGHQPQATHRRKD